MGYNAAGKNSIARLVLAKQFNENIVGDGLYFSGNHIDFGLSCCLAFLLHARASLPLFYLISAYPGVIANPVCLCVLFYFSVRLSLRLLCIFSWFFSCSPLCISGVWLWLLLLKRATFGKDGEWLFLRVVHVLYFWKTGFRTSCLTSSCVVKNRKPIPIL